MKTKVILTQRGSDQSVVIKHRNRTRVIRTGEDAQTIKRFLSKLERTGSIEMVAS